MQSGSLFEDIISPLAEESISVLANGRYTRVERIVSRGQASPKDFWYDQEEGEYVLLVAGAAVLEFEDTQRTLRAGDWVDIPAHVRHRVAWTDPDRDTIWLAVFYR
jgi:cupin 2 domain-containing protein